jgi:hypothetical protein
VFDYIAQSWFNIRHEGFFDVGPLLITTRRWHNGNMKNGLDLGRDYGRMKVGAPRVSLPPKPRHLSSV